MHVGNWARKYRLILLFTFTAAVAIFVAAMLVNIVVGNLAENNLNRLIRLAEEDTRREARHLQVMATEMLAPGRRAQLHARHASHQRQGRTRLHGRDA